MTSRRPWLSSLYLGCATSLLASGASADPLRFHLQAGAAKAVVGTQANDTGWGGVGAVAVEYVLAPVVGLQLELSNVSLSGGDPPQDSTLAQKGASSAQAAQFGVRLRPLARSGASAYGAPLVPAGLWLAGAGGVTKTGDLVRPVFDAHIGYDVVLAPFGVGPFVGYEQVIQSDKSLRPDDAHIVLFGLHATYGLPVPGAYEGVADRDHDGISDSVDKCPDEPEDKDGYQDEDGCPEPDNDRDGVLDVADACPNEPGPATQDPKTNGCPPRDRDRDGILDPSDKCPDDPEDKDGFEDDDGCPDPDNDKDNIPDAKDKCPNEPEVVNGYADEDGCPDDAQVRVVGDKILLDDRVHFDTNKAIVLGQSYPLLQRVARLIGSHPEYTHVEVAGYADERGPEAYNQALSEARAKAVMAILLRYGHFDPKRLSAVGYGTANPRIAESNEKAWRENRRTEFTITRESTQTTYTDFPGANEIERPAGAVPRSGKSGAVGTSSGAGPKNPSAERTSEGAHVSGDKR